MEGLEKGLLKKNTAPRPYFDAAPSSKEFIAAKKVTEHYIDSGKAGLNLTETPENIASLQLYLEKLGNRLPPGTSITGVIEELKKAGVITKPAPVEKKKETKPNEFIETKYVTLEKPKRVELSPEQLQILEANLLLEEVEKANVFKNSEELNFLYAKSTESDHASLENEDYYYAFSAAGLIKGGADEVRKDLEYLAEKKQQFAEQEFNDAKQKEKIERAKKIATITERALIQCVSNLHWFGEDINIEPASEFDDIKHGVDDMLEIRKEDEESSFMCLGIDVTFRGLYSEQFKHKFFTLLRSIREGYKTKVKYFRNHKNEMMREFTVPKIVLYFSVDDVKELVGILKGLGASAPHSTSKRDLLKCKVMRQIINSCMVLAGFAEESKNNVFRKYIAVINSIKELAWKNTDIEAMLNIDPKDEVSRHLQELVDEFKLIEKQNDSPVVSSSYE